ncbi:MAG: AraC family transcriptional regulator, partial [Pseudomonas sp.]|nr:AraC family transcriptional regulator [Pseudomonas sp.]
GSTLRVSEPHRVFDQQTWQRLRDWLESRLDDPPTLEEIAAFCAMSPWQALRRFRQHTGLPPHQWLTQLRLQRALPLVLAGEPLSEIALRLGFYDQAHFSRLFRRTYGLPPARLRQG